MTVVRTRTLKAYLVHPSTQAPLLNHKVTIMLYGGAPGWIDDGTVSNELATGIVGKWNAWTDNTGLLDVPNMASNVDIAPSGSAYSIQIFQQTAPVIFTLQPDPGNVNNSDAWLFDNLAPIPGSPGGSGGVSVAVLAAYQAQVAAEFAGLSDTYAPLQFLAQRVNGRYYPAVAAGMTLNPTTGRYSYSAGAAAVAKMAVDPSTSRYYPAPIGA